MLRSCLTHSKTKTLITTFNNSPVARMLNVQRACLFMYSRTFYFSPSFSFFLVLHSSALKDSYKRRNCQQKQYPPVLTKHLCVRHTITQAPHKRTSTCALHIKSMVFTLSLDFILPISFLHGCARLWPTLIHVYRNVSFDSVVFYRERAFLKEVRTHTHMNGWSDKSSTQQPNGISKLH